MVIQYILLTIRLISDPDLHSSHPKPLRPISYEAPALALKCYQCIQDASGTCNDQVICPYRCGSSTSRIVLGGYQHEISEKICSAAVESVSGSINMGVDKMSINIRLCSTDLCNNQILPALPFGPQNGRKCYTCSNNDCTKTLNCEGDEDRCFTATVQCNQCIPGLNGTCTDTQTSCTDQCASKTHFMNYATEAGTPVTMKGCASESVCNAIKSSIWGRKNLTIIEMSCCKGNMCNSAAGVKLSLLIMLVPLLSSFFL
ncbi:hypothetical protein NFI96_028382 [Prochilodus magdalenae]|nr:hypothetical protein NFI96_028382 [Prochilodus magdalenae]